MVVRFDEALRAGSHRAAKWPKRGQADNRLEPECWPALTPKFTLPADARVFTIGSCFARHVEKYLHDLGMQVPVVDYMHANADLFSEGGTELLNRYTPPAIYQELAWTRRILQRDGVVRPDDIAPFLVDMGRGLVKDIQRPINDSLGVRPEEAVAFRQKFFDLFRQAFDCDVVIITLGLIECWWHPDSQSYVDLVPDMPISVRETLEFRRLRFEDAYRYTRDAIDLLRLDGPRRVLITTSPVPLGRTFTRDDVIVANSHSKSVLRAVAGQLSDEDPDIDYFPSYESVMLTRQPHVWSDDLMHVDPTFVGRVMMRFAEAYSDLSAPESDGRLNLVLELTNLVKQGRPEEAARLYDRAASNGASEDCSGALHMAAAGALAQTGRTDEARRHLDLARKAAWPGAGDEDISVLHQAAGMLDTFGDREEAGRVRMRVMQRRALFIPVYVVSLIEAGRRDDAIDILRMIETDLSDQGHLLRLAAVKYEELGLPGDAERIYRLALFRNHAGISIVAPFANLLLTQGRQDEALAMLEAAADISPDHERTLTLVRRIRTGRHQPRPAAGPDKAEAG